MTDDAVMRAELQRVAAYRELCAAVRRSGRHNAVFAGLMLALAVGVGGNNAVFFAVVVVAELLIGLYKWLAPSAEGVLLDGVVLVAFAGLNLVREGFKVADGGRPETVFVVLGLFLLWGAVGRFRAYGQLRRLFADRPTRDQLAWFADLAAEIRRADPETDATALDLPTRPHFKAKLLGGTAFLVTGRGEAAVIAGPWDIAFLPTGKVGRTGPRVRLRLFDREFPAFEIDPRSLDNFNRWAAAALHHPPPDAAP